MKKIVKILVVSLLTLVASVNFLGCNQDGTGNNGDDSARVRASTIYKEAADAVWALLGKTNPTKTQVVLAGLNMPNHTTEETGESQKQSYIHNLNIMTLYVNFIGDLLANENFVYTDKVVNFNIVGDAGSGSSSYNIAIYSEINEQDGKIYSEFVLSSEFDQEGTLYMLMDIGYNFGTKVANSFRLIYCNEYLNNGEYVKFLNDQIYTKEGKCYINTNYEDYAQEMQAFIDNFKVRKAQGITLTSSFDKEYQTMLSLSAQLS